MSKVIQPSVITIVSLLKWFQVVKQSSTTNVRQKVQESKNLRFYPCISKIIEIYYVSKYVFDE